MVQPDPAIKLNETAPTPEPPVNVRIVIWPIFKVSLLFVIRMGALVLVVSLKRVFR